MKRNKVSSMTNIIEPLFNQGYTNSQIAVKLSQPLWRIQNATGYIQRKNRDKESSIDPFKLIDRRKKC